MSLLIDLLRGSNCTLMNKMKKNLQSNILLLPALIAGFFCYLFPILIAFWKSLFLGTGTDFVGIQNYVDLFENEAFSLAVRNLFHLWAIIVPVNLVIGIFIAEAYIKLRQEKLCLFFLVPSILPAACVVAFPNWLSFCPHTCNCLQMCGHFFVETSKVDKTLKFFQKSCHKRNANYVD